MVDVDYEDEEIDSEEDYQDGDEDDEDLQTKPSLASGRTSTTAPNRGRSNSLAINTGNGNLANNLLGEEDDEDTDSILSSNVQGVSNGNSRTLLTPESVMLFN